MRLRSLLVPFVACFVVLLTPSATFAQLTAEDALATSSSKWAEDVGALEPEAVATTAELLRAELDANSESIAILDEDLGFAPESGKADLEAEIDALKSTRRKLLARLKTVVAALEAGDLKTQLEAFHTVETGEASEASAGALALLLQEYANRAKTWAVDNGPGLAMKLALVLAILWVFKIFARITGKVIGKSLDSKKFNTSSLLREFAVAMTRRLVMLVGLLVALQQLGFQIGPILAGLGVIGFVLGFALQDTLGNLAAGVMILLYRPFDIGDVVSAGGVTGKVERLNISSTTMLTPDNQQLVVPNSAIWGGVIQNVTARDTRRVDLVCGVSYDDDIEHVQRVLEEIAAGHELTLDDPAPTIQLHNLGDSSVDFIVRPWCKTSDYWTVYWDLTREFKRRLDAEGISIPYPQRDLHIIPNGGGELTPVTGGPEAAAADKAPAKA